MLKKDVEDFIELSDDGKTLIKCYTNQQTIEIPGSVEIIEDYAFMFSLKLRKIIIPENVKILKNVLFNVCGVETIFIGKGVEYIDDGAFLGAEEIQSFIVDPLNPYFTSVNGVLYDKKMERLVCFPPRTRVKNDEYVLPKTLKSIDLYAVGLNKFVKSVVLNENLTPIDWNVFAGFYNLKKISVSPENKYFHIEKQFLLTKDKTTLISYFNHNDEAVIIPNTVKKIVSKAFPYEIEIKKIHLSKDIELIQEWGFQIYEHLIEDVDVYYDDTKERFKQKVVVLENKELLSANWHYKKS